MDTFLCICIHMKNRSIVDVATIKINLQHMALFIALSVKSIIKITLGECVVFAKYLASAVQNLFLSLPLSFSLPYYTLAEGIIILIIFMIRASS